MLSGLSWFCWLLSYVHYGNLFSLLKSPVLQLSSYKSHSRSLITLLSSSDASPALVWDEEIKTACRNRSTNHGFIQWWDYIFYWSVNLPFSVRFSKGQHTICYQHRWPIWRLRCCLTNDLPPPSVSFGVLLSQWLTNTLCSKICLVITSLWFTGLLLLFLPDIPRAMHCLPLLALQFYSIWAHIPLPKPICRIVCCVVLLPVWEASWFHY